MAFSTSLFRRNGYYTILPTDTVLSECQFTPATTELKLTLMQALVGGYIELVRLPGADGIVNEEGKLKGLPYNPLGTAIYGNPSDEIVGTMLVLCGTARLS